MILLISWCAWTTFQARTDLSVLYGVYVFKDRLVCFFRSLWGYTSQSVPGTGDAGDYDGRDTGGMLNRLRTFRQAFESLDRLGESGGGREGQTGEA